MNDTQKLYVSVKVKSLELKQHVPCQQNLFTCMTRRLIPIPLNFVRE